jgi:hypothetical protein
MLIPQTASCQTGGRQGRLPVGLAELRRALATPSALGDGDRRRLRELDQRLARVRALGDEYARVSFSPAVCVALQRDCATA